MILFVVERLLYKRRCGGLHASSFHSIGNLLVKLNIRDGETTGLRQKTGQTVQDPTIRARQFDLSTSPHAYYLIGWWEVGEKR